MKQTAENIDCMVGMSRYPDKYFELEIVDPPYGIEINMNMVRGLATFHIPNFNLALNPTHLLTDKKIIMNVSNICAPCAFPKIIKYYRKNMLGGWQHFTFRTLIWL